jgi:hypothetical protein
MTSKDGQSPDPETREDEPVRLSVRGDRVRRNQATAVAMTRVQAPWTAASA